MPGHKLFKQLKPQLGAIVNHDNRPRSFKSLPSHSKVDPNIICGYTDQYEPNQYQSSQFFLIENTGPNKPDDPGCPDKNP
jgi:hypothetical protein